MSDELPDALDLLSGGGLIKVQQRQPAPRDQDALRYGAQPRQTMPRQQQRMPAAAPQMQPQQQTLPDQAQPQPSSDLSMEWVGIMQRHGIGSERWADMVGEHDRAASGQPPRTGNPALDADISTYAKRYREIGARPRPAPSQPEAMPSQMAQPGTPQPQPQQQPQAGVDLPDAMDMMQGETAAPQRQAQARPMNPNAEADAPTWFGRRLQDVRGRQDPRYRGLPNIAGVLRGMDGDTGTQIGGEAGSWLLGASDKDMGRTYQAMLGKRFIRQEADANGYPIIVYRDQGGQEARAYVNNPGIDAQDVLRGVYGGLPFAKAGQVIGRAVQGAPLIGRMGAQAIGQAGTSVAQDAAAVGTGVSDFDLVNSGIKAGVAGAGGAVFEGVGAAMGPLIRRYITEPRYYNRSTGELTEEGIRMARQAGVDPETLTQQVAQEFAKGIAGKASPDTAFRAATSKEFGIRRSQGELTGNREQLLREQQMRGGTYGTSAREGAEQFDKMQRDDVIRATRGVSPPGAANPSVAETIAPGRRPQLARTMGLDDTGYNIKSNTDEAFSIAKGKEEKAWEAVPRLKATPEALAELDGAIANTFQARGGVIIDDEITPWAAKMSRDLDAFKAGQTPSKAAGILPETSVGDIQTMRKRLLAARMKADSPEDQRSARAIYDSFIEWEVVAAEKAGDMTAAALSRTARDHTKQLHAIFDGQQNTPAADILAKVMKKADTPEGIVNALFTGPTAQIKNGSVTALSHLKRAYDTYLEPAAAKTAWDDIRLAYWLKHTADKGNEVQTPGNLAKAIKSMMGTQSSVMKSLYTPVEIAQMKRLAVAMDDIKRKNPNTSWSAIGVGALMKDMANGILNMLGWNSVLGKTLAGTAARPFSAAYGSAQAGKAFGGGQGAGLNPMPNVNNRVGGRRLYLDLPAGRNLGGALTSSQTD